MDYPEENIYQTARKKANITQEQAAELLDKSSSCVRKWESYAFKAMVMDNVAEMAYQYNSSILMWQYLKLFSPFKDDLPNIEFGNGIQGTALFLHDAKKDYDKWHEIMMSIIKDGKVDETELEEWKQVRATGWEYAGKIISLIVLCDEMMGIKKGSEL